VFYGHGTSGGRDPIRSFNHARGKHAHVIVHERTDDHRDEVDDDLGTRSGTRGPNDRP
jgi:hypothetical protein